eukprot:TRINITY_DN13180_c0_g1_i2.p1 TRINITY_DN13180_c0_g1~~TRINITY_DN13180_c0_g1_i2.p1  ORF type:complete len:352 (+),score=54.84 TRINITY_DN13180_c0_g1_i2:152-1057(+)
MAELEVIEVGGSDGEKNLIAALQRPRSTILLADPPKLVPHLHHAKHLKWFQSTYAGVDPIFKMGDARRDWALTRIAGVFGPKMAEYVVGQIISNERHFKTFDRFQREALWPPDKNRIASYRELCTLTVGVLGLGDIGAEVARYARFLGMKVHGVRRTKQPTPNVDVLFDESELGAFLGSVDYIVNTLPSTPHTRGLLGGDVLRECKKGCVLINVGRGDVISEGCLVRAIEEGWLGGAVLDVFPVEPLPSTSPLWHLPGVTITPHISALSLSHQVVSIFKANLQRYLQNETLLYLVNWDQGY